MGLPFPVSAGTCQHLACTCGYCCWLLMLVIEVLRGTNVLTLGVITYIIGMGNFTTYLH